MGTDFDFSNSNQNSVCASTEKEASSAIVTRKIITEETYYAHDGDHLSATRPVTTNRWY
jgi:hypothetical protein